MLVSCVSACGACRFCREARYGQCTGGGGWILGNEIDGTQAEYVRVPFADNSTYPVPAGVSDEDLLMLADILPTAYEVGVLNGHVQPGDVVAVVGAGPIGLSAISGARLFSPSLVIAIDMAASRLEAAKQFGADVVINNAEQDPIAAVIELTGGLGVDVAIEAVGVPATFELAADLVRPVGRVANIGVHGKPVTLHLERLWTRDVTITTGLVDTYSTPTLLRLLTSHQIDAERFVTHRFGFDDFNEAYDVFARAGETSALKVVLSRRRPVTADGRGAVPCRSPMGCDCNRALHRSPAQLRSGHRSRPHRDLGRHCGLASPAHRRCTRRQRAARRDGCTELDRAQAARGDGRRTRRRGRIRRLVRARRHQRRRPTRHHPVADELHDEMGPRSWRYLSTTKRSWRRWKQRCGQPPRAPTARVSAPPTAGAARTVTWL